MYAEAGSNREAATALKIFGFAGHNALLPHSHSDSKLPELSLERRASLDSLCHRLGFW